MESIENSTDSYSPVTFRNPIKLHGADPWLTWHEGWYYLATTAGTHVPMRRARRLADLHSAPDSVIWEDTVPSRSKHIWAPEFFLLDSGNGLRWYLYYTASDEIDENHRMYVAEGEGSDPRGPYTFKAMLETDPDNAYYAIDGTVLKTRHGALYFIWCGRPSTSGQGLYISRMANPWELIGGRVALAADGFGCSEVREGPVALVRNGRVILIYSACDTGKPDYQLGMLIADSGADLMHPASWQQHPLPVFNRADAHGVFGPGHNCFFQSPDGAEDWIVYHAKTTSEYTYRERSTRVQRFLWNLDGTPNFGIPLSLDCDIPAPSGEP